MPPTRSRSSTWRPLGPARRASRWFRPASATSIASEIEDYAFDIDAANALLDEAGYEDTDGDGVRECLADQDCDDLTFRFNYPPMTSTRRRARRSCSRSTWQQIGVAIEIQVLDADTLTQRLLPGLRLRRDHVGLGLGSGSGVPARRRALLARSRSGFSETGYCNPEYDELYDAQAVELDRDARVDLIHQMQQILMDDVPYIIPYYYPTIEAWRTDTFTGWIEDDPTLGLEDRSSSRCSDRPSRPMRAGRRFGARPGPSGARSTMSGRGALPRSARSAGRW